MNRRLILASASPRRTDLMNKAGLTFEVIPADVDELEDPDLGIEQLVSRNAALKARHVSASHLDAVVIGADTLVALDGAPLGKPNNLDHAFEMLSRLVGKTHVVCTGVCLCLGEIGVEVQFIEQTHVTFRPLDEGEIRSYLALINPLDKAGSYAAQDHGERIIASTDGSWTNVVGLPMERLLAELERL
ncbi:MAG: Maf family protein [Verrucomicrobiota bacterium]